MDLRASGLVRSMRDYGPGADGQAVFDPFTVDLFHVPSQHFEGATGAELIAFVEQVCRSGGGVIAFHGVGGDRRVNSAEAHEALVDYLAAHQRDIWVTTFGELMALIPHHIRQQASCSGCSMAKGKTKTAIYHPPKSGMPYLVVSVSPDGADVTAVSSKEEARILASKKTLKVSVEDRQPRDKPE
jgi:hypothetical protein